MRVSFFAALVAFASATNAVAEEAPWGRFEKLPADAEVHAVAISEPTFRGVRTDEITDWQGLIKALRAKDGPGAYIRKRLPPSADEVLTAEAEMGKVGDLEPTAVPVVARLQLAKSFGRAMWFKSFYDKEAFAGVELTARAKGLIAVGDKRTIYQNELLNRELLAATFPKLVAPAPADFHLTRITVKAGKPVVLVLSCAYQCRWEVVVEKGATVAGVALLGGGAQELSGVDAPVVYAAGFLPDGTETRPAASYTSKRTGKEYELMVAAVKGMTGREYTTFQGHHTAPKEPYVVRPSAK